MSAEEEKAASDAADAMLTQAAEQLGEHFDAVQIFVCRNDGSEAGTFYVARGGGNFYARLGMIQEWFLRYQAKTQLETVQRLKQEGAQ